MWCDQTELARMENGRYFTVTLDPGKHTFSSNDKQSGIELDAKAGQEYFVRVEIASGMMKGHGRLTLVAPEQGPSLETEASGFEQGGERHHSVGQRGASGGRGSQDETGGAGRYSLVTELNFGGLPALLLPQNFWPILSRPLRKGESFPLVEASEQKSKKTL